MTLRQIDIALKAIDRRTHNAFALRASLHGIKIPLKTSPSRKPEVRLDPQTEKAVEDHVMRTLAEKQAALRARHG